MKYAVIELTGEIRGYVVKRAPFNRRNRVFVGSYGECIAWIANFKQTLDRVAANTVTALSPPLVQWDHEREAS
jgi:hypothetical protein